MNAFHARVFARPGRVKTHGFSLIEVLIAVLVLGVGLLGLASVFPVVISQQRDATDIIRGGVASGAIRDQIRSNPDILYELISQDGVADRDEGDLDGDRAPNDLNDFATDGDSDGVPDSFNVQQGEEPIFGHDAQFNPSAIPNPTNDGNGRFNPFTGYSYLWEADWQWSGSFTPLNAPQTVGVGPWLNEYRQDGGVRFRDTRERQLAGVGDAVPDLSVLARLYPRPYSLPGDSSFDGPQFVWDFVPRRRPSGDLQIVVFVRRISTGIRVGSGETLSDVLGNPANRVFPVSREPGTGFTTTDGTGEYAIPLSTVAEAIPAIDYPALADARASNDPGSVVIRDGIRVRAQGGDQQVSNVTQFTEIIPLAEVGQMFVDNLGVVRTVVEVLAVNEGQQLLDLRVEPAFVQSELLPSFDIAINQQGGAFSVREAARIGKLRQIVFTPQRPVDVFTMEFSQ